MRRIQKTFIYISSAVAQFLLNWPYDAVRPNQVVQLNGVTVKERKKERLQQG